MGRAIGFLLLVVYIVVGLFVAEANDYFADLGSFESILSAVLAVLLWPLVLLDINLQISEGQIDEPSGGDGGSGGEPSGGGN